MALLHAQNPANFVNSYRTKWSNHKEGGPSAPHLTIESTGPNTYNDYTCDLSSNSNQPDMINSFKLISTNFGGLRSETLLQVPKHG